MKLIYSFQYLTYLHYEQMSHDEVWDDTLLIQQYDSTMDHLKMKVSQRIGCKSSDKSQVLTKKLA